MNPTDIIKDEKQVLAIESKATTIDEKNATVTFVLSTSDRDRHGDVIEQSSWQLDDFMNNPVFLEQHRSNEFPIGKFTKVYVEENPDGPAGSQRLMGEVKFAVEEYDRAKLAFSLVANGFMNSVSVGFIPHEVDYSDELRAFIMRDCELLEVSLVSVPANPNARAKMVMKAAEAGIDATPLFTKEKGADRKVIIEAKQRIESEVKDMPDTPARSKKLTGVQLLNKALRNLK